MASYLVNMLVVVLFCLVGVRGADIGDDCDPTTDACAGGTLDVVCDAIKLKCSIQAGQKCDGEDHDDKCVSNAECDTGTNACTCKDDYTAENGICGKTIGQDCNPDSDICVAGALEVTCDETAKKCLIKAEGDCNGAGNDQNCVSNAECEGDTTCKCESDYTDVNGVCGKTIGQDCNPDSDICVDGALEVTCDKTAKKCLIKAEGDCSGAGNDQNCVSNAECEGDTTCKCESGYTDVNGVCGKTIGQDCNPDSDICVDGTLEVTCDSGKCLIQVGEQCDGQDHGDKCVSNAQCADDICKEKKDIGDFCEPDTDVCVDGALKVTCDETKDECSIQAGERCNGTNHGDKCVSNSDCDTDSDTCTCKDGYTAGNGICKKDKVIGEECDPDTDTCFDDTLEITCDKTAEKCLIKEGQDCSNNEDNCVTNAECTSDTCSCKDGYTENNGICEREDDNGGGIVAVSFAVVALVSVVSLLFTLH